MDKQGLLLESGTYENNHYGTPKPPPDPPSHAVLPGYSRAPASSGYSPREPLMPGNATSGIPTQVLIVDCKLCSVLCRLQDQVSPGYPYLKLQVLYQATGK